MQQVNQRPSVGSADLRRRRASRHAVTLTRAARTAPQTWRPVTMGGRSSGYERVVTASAGSGNGQACSVATQAQDCPYGYCSPYTSVCNELEGAACTDADCPGAAPAAAARARTQP